MKITLVTCATHVSVKGQSTLRLSLNDTHGVDTLEHDKEHGGVVATYAAHQNGKRVKRTLWVPNDNIVSVQYADEEVKAEAKK